MDAHASVFLPVVQEAAIEFLQRIEARITPLDNGLVPLDADVTPFDNSQTKKQGVSRTYKGRRLRADGGLPGARGILFGTGVARRQATLPEGHPGISAPQPAAARRLADKSILLRLDGGGNDAIENIDVVMAHNEQHPDELPVHYLIKWNPRQQDPHRWLAYAEEYGEWSEPRTGKRVALFTVSETRSYNGYEYPLRRVMRVIERSIDKHGQPLLLPDIEIEGWWTSVHRPGGRGNHPPVRRSRHRGAVTQRGVVQGCTDYGAEDAVQDRPGHRAATLGQVHHQYPVAGLCAGCLQHPALDWTERPARSRCPVAAQSQAPAHSHRDAGVDVSGCPVDPQ
jgi:hypothetical protein